MLLQSKVIDIVTYFLVVAINIFAWVDSVLSSLSQNSHNHFHVISANRLYKIQEHSWNTKCSLRVSYL